MEPYKYADPNRGSDERRVPTMEKRSFVVSEMWERHHDIARRIALGQTNKQISEALGVTTVMVSNVRNSPVVKEKTQELVSRMDNEAVDVGKRIRELAPQALKVLEQVLTDDDDTIPMSLKVKTAQDMLDRAGHAAIKKVEGKFMHGHFDREDLDEIKQLARDSGVIVDVESVELPV